MNVSLLLVCGEQTEPKSSVDRLPSTSSPQRCPMEVWGADTQSSPLFTGDHTAASPFIFSALYWWNHQLCSEFLHLASPFAFMSSPDFSLSHFRGGFFLTPSPLQFTLWAVAPGQGVPCSQCLPWPTPWAMVSRVRAVPFPDLTGHCWKVLEEEIQGPY